ncbi:FimV/HubP family polar landmark protein [Marinomonas pollencensis]|uniref:Pilus assembly protein FimV n=1 Tax=Marinomonas pollencensis TaxID=491954 RepID=A0A3E0DKL4_9GAMM|nr:FimV/HubP family polar landmark protein [Marinomonas pollencensis]REG83294.1 pilus assembly protein FimV [Marinomonas pollencensis]
MLRKTLISLAVSGAFYVSSGYALELGELTSQSNLDEPFRGQIALSDYGVLTPEDILVRLGSEGEFRQAGLTPAPDLSLLKFNVQRAGNGNDLVIGVTSTQPIKDKELHFVLAARWPSGQVVREYQTPLNQSALVDKSQQELVRSTRLPTSQASSNRVFRDAAAAAESMTSRGNIFTSRGNTLWSIADKNTLSNRLNIYQTMMAIQALNKNAFYSNNINLLKEGVVLRLPTEQQIALFNKSLSQAEFSRQHNAWMALKGAAAKNASVERAQMNTQAEGKGASQSPVSSSDKLTLSSGQSLLPEQSASSNAGNGKNASELNTQLSAAQEMLDKEKREKEDLSSQLGDLNKQLETLQKLITLKDKQMAELEKQFASAQQSLQEQKNTVDQLLEADQARRAKEQAEQDSLKNKIFGNPIVVSIGAVVLLLLGFLGGMLMRRLGKKKQEADTGNDEFDLAAPAAVAATAAVAAAPAEAQEDSIEEDPFQFDLEDADSEESMLNDSVEQQEMDDEIFDFAEDLSIPEEALPEDDEEDELEDPFASLDEQMDELAEEEDLEDLEDGFGDLEPELEPIPEDEIPTVETELEDFETESLEDASAPEEDTEFSEEESFVSSLLNDEESAGNDESALFDKTPDESLASSIEETLAEAQDELETIDVPSFGEAEAAAGAEVDDEEEAFDFFDASGDEVATKLDLARAYMDMGDDEGARVILDDVVSTGNEKQIAEAKSMMERMFPSD